MLTDVMPSLSLLLYLACQVAPAAIAERDFLSSYRRREALMWCGVGNSYSVIFLSDDYRLRRSFSDFFVNGYKFRQKNVTKMYTKINTKPEKDT